MEAWPYNTGGRSREADTDTLSVHSDVRPVSVMISSHVTSSLTRTVNIAVFVSGTFDLFGVACKQYHWVALNPFLNRTKNGDVDGTCKRGVRYIPLRYCQTSRMGSMATSDGVHK